MLKAKIAQLMMLGSCIGICSCTCGCVLASWDPQSSILLNLVLAVIPHFLPCSISLANHGICMAAVIDAWYAWHGQTALVQMNAIPLFNSVYLRIKTSL